MVLSTGLKPYRAGSLRIRVNVSQAENNMTVASGWVVAKLTRPRRNSSFQFPNRTTLSPILAPVKPQASSNTGVEMLYLPIGDIYNGGTSMKRKLRAPARYRVSCAAKRLATIGVISALSFVYLKRVSVSKDAEPSNSQNSAIVCADPSD